jgi:hypothetical protein
MLMLVLQVVGDRISTEAVPPLCVRFWLRKQHFRVSVAHLQPIAGSTSTASWHNTHQSVVKHSKFAD